MAAFSPISCPIEPEAIPFRRMLMACIAVALVFSFRPSSWAGMCTGPFAAAEALVCGAGEDAAGDVAPGAAACCPPPHAASMIAVAPRATRPPAAVTTETARRAEIMQAPQGIDGPISFAARRLGPKLAPVTIRRLWVAARNVAARESRPGKAGYGFLAAFLSGSRPA